MTSRTPEHARSCPSCGAPLIGRQRNACGSARCRKAVQRARPAIISPEDRALVDKVVAEGAAELDVLLGPRPTREQLRERLEAARAAAARDADGDVLDGPAPRPDYARRRAVQDVDGGPSTDRGQRENVDSTRRRAS